MNTTLNTKTTSAAAKTAAAAAAAAANSWDIIDGDGFYHAKPAAKPVKQLAQSTLARRARIQEYASASALTRAAGIACSDSAAIAAIKAEGLDTLYNALKARKNRPQLPAICGVVLGHDFSQAPNPQSLTGFNDFINHVADYVVSATFKTKVAKARSTRCIGMLRAAYERAIISAQADKANQAKQ